MVSGTAYGFPCPSLKSRPDEWVTASVDELVQRARAAYESDKALSAYESVLDEIAGTIRQCRLSEDQNFISRYRVFIDYIEAASFYRQPDHELGFSVTDKQYFEETRQYVQIPEFLMDQGFLRSVSRFETLERAKSFLRRLNSNRKPSEQLIFLSYTSRHLGTPDNKKSYRRLLVVLPGNAEKGVPEKWIQFGVSNPGARARVRNVSIVSAMVGSDGTFNAYFKDFYRTYRRDRSINMNGRWELGYGDDSCVKCHKSGILPIFPAPGSVNASELQAVLKVNQRFLTYGSPRFGKYVDERKLGPGLGSASWDDRLRRFGVGFEGTVAGRAMICADCHQQEGLGALNWPMDRILISSYIKGGQMPFGYEIRSSDQAKLYEKLIQEYFATDKTNPGILKSWLLSKLQQ